MLVLHAGFRAPHLLLWGESSLLKEMRRKERPAHPFDAGPLRLAEALGAIGIEISRKDFRTEEVWLPSTAQEPALSSPLIAERLEKQPTKIAPWKVTIVALPPAAAIELLCFCASKELLQPGTVIGADLAYWAAALRWAGSLLTRQHFLPDLTQEDGEFRARWQAAYMGRDDDLRCKLAVAMPPAARALTPDLAADTLLRAFLDTVIDEQVRSSLAVRRQSGGELHDRWLAALHSADGKLSGPKTELQTLERQLREWRRPIAAVSTAPFRLCFRLEEPEERNDKAPWQVRYLLQARHDPSLLVPAENVWTAKGTKSAVWRQPGFRAQEHLLFSLGQASGICPRIAESLQSPAPSGYEVDTAGAFDFLNTKAKSLEEAGFGVMVPSWWSRGGTKARLTVSASVKSPFQKKGILSLETLLDFQWEVSIGGEKITLAELRALAAWKTPLVKFRGQWVQISAEEIQAALEFWKKQKSQMTAREAVHMGLGATQPNGPIEFAGISAEGWLNELFEKLEGRTPFEEIQPPEGLQAKLRQYQIRGYSWLAFVRHWGFGACLADDMGLGKTVQTLSLIQRDRQSGVNHPVLVLCPTSVVGNWQREAARFTPELSVLMHHGVSRAKGDKFIKNASQQAIVISSYALLYRDFEHLKEVPWAGIVLDEAQNIKNPETKQSAAARALRAEYRIALTGTPVENTIGDLWSIMEFLNPGLLGTRAEFKRRFFLPIQSNSDQQAADRLKKLTGPFILRRVKTDPSVVTDLPKKLEMKVFCTLTKEQASLYAAVVNDSMEAIESAEGIGRKGLVLSTLMRLKQVCNHPAQFLRDRSPLPNRSGKLARLTEMIEEAVSVEDRVLIFSQFAEMGQMIQQHLQETFAREALFLHGGIAKKRRDQMVERFQEEQDGPPFFILSLKAGGTGLNLTRANHVFHFDRWWNPAVENQATDRAFRLGQKKNVQVHKFICAGTLEEKIDEMIESKKGIAAKVVGTGEGWLTELSTSQLKDLFTLRKTAVAE
jgi:SNF2 family DNA or RNA helicase